MHFLQRDARATHTGVGTRSHGETATEERNLRNIFRVGPAKKAGKIATKASLCAPRPSLVQRFRVIYIRSCGPSRGVSGFPRCSPKASSCSPPLVLANPFIRIIFITLKWRCNSSKFRFARFILRCNFTRFVVIYF